MASTPPPTSTKTAVSVTSPGVKTMLSAQPSLANTNVSQMDVQQSTTSDALTAAANAQIRPPISANIRFTVALAVLITQGLAQLLTIGMATSQSSIIYGLGVLFSIFLTFFCSEWIRIHSFALTRQKRAFFDEANILETYQPRARTHGHLFHPDPPTPGPVVKIADDPNRPDRTSSEKAAFKANRDAHYANMFEYALRVAKEAEESDRQALAAQRARLASEADAKNANVKSPPSAPQGEPLYDNLSTMPPVSSTPPAPPNDLGTPIQLPTSLIEAVDDKSIRDKAQSPDALSASERQSITGASKTGSETASASSSSNASSVSTGKSRTASPTSAAAKSGQKRKKKPISLNACILFEDLFYILN